MKSFDSGVVARLREKFADKLSKKMLSDSRTREC